MNFTFSTKKELPEVIVTLSLQWYPRAFRVNLCSSILVFHPTLNKRILYK